MSRTLSLFRSLAGQCRERPIAIAREGVGAYRARLHAAAPTVHRAAWIEVKDAFGVLTDSVDDLDLEAVGEIVRFRHGPEAWHDDG